jgi:hypothetical protein
MYVYSTVRVRVRARDYCKTRCVSYEGIQLYTVHVVSYESTFVRKYDTFVGPTKFMKVL